MRDGKRAVSGKEQVSGKNKSVEKSKSMERTSQWKEQVRKGGLPPLLRGLNEAGASHPS
jgi:hypothetical protein